MRCLLSSTAAGTRSCQSCWIIKLNARTFVAQAADAFQITEQDLPPLIAYQRYRRLLERHRRLIWKIKAAGVSDNRWLVEAGIE